MTQEPFTAEGLRTDKLTDSKGRPIGRLLSSRYDEDGRQVAALEVELSEDVRRERLVNDRKLQVAAWAVKLENGSPRLTMTLDELLDDQQVSHSRPNPRGLPPDRPPHFGAPADETKAPKKD